MADIQSATAEIRRGKKKKEEKTTGKNIMVCPIPWATIIRGLHYGCLLKITLCPTPLPLRHASSSPSLVFSTPSKTEPLEINDTIFVTGRMPFL